MANTDLLYLLVRDENCRLWECDFLKLTRPEQVFRCVFELSGQVNNGGFEQYYFNSSGEIAQYCPDALWEIGALNTFFLVTKANSVFEYGCPPADSELRISMLNDLPESADELLYELSKEFFRDPDGLDDLLVKYLIENHMEIAGSTKVIANFNLE